MLMELIDSSSDSRHNGSEDEESDDGAMSQGTILLASHASVTDLENRRCIDRGRHMSSNRADARF